MSGFVHGFLQGSSDLCDLHALLHIHSLATSLDTLDRAISSIFTMEHNLE